MKQNCNVFGACFILKNTMLLNFDNLTTIFKIQSLAMCVLVAYNEAKAKKPQKN